MTCRNRLFPCRVQYITDSLLSQRANTCGMRSSEASGSDDSSSSQEICSGILVKKNHLFGFRYGMIMCSSISGDSVHPVHAVHI